MIEPMGFTLRFPNSLMAVFSAYLINYTIPRAGEISRATILTNYEGVPFEKGFGTIVAERVADALVMFLIVIITFFLEFDFIYNFLFAGINFKKQWLFFMLFTAILYGLYLLFKRGKHPLILKFKAFFWDFWRAL